MSLRTAISITIASKGERSRKMAGQITREELLAAQQNKSPKKPHLKLTITIDRTETKISSFRKPPHHHLLMKSFAFGSNVAIAIISEHR